MKPKSYPTLEGVAVAARGTLRDGTPAHIHYGNEPAKDVAQRSGRPTLVANTRTGDYSTSEDMLVEFERVVSTEVRGGYIYPIERRWEVVHD